MSAGNLLNRLFDFRLLRRILGLAAPFRKQFYGAMVLAVLLALFSVLSPALIKITIDDYVMAGNMQMLYVMTAVMFGAIVLQSALSYVFTFLSGWLGQNIILRLRTTVFGHLVKSNVSFFDRTPIGTATTRTINDVETINDVFAEGIITIVSDLLTIIAVMAFMIYTSWKLTLAALVVMPILLVAAYFFKEGIRSSFTDVRNQVARLNAFLQEHITGMHIVQLFNAGGVEFDKFKTINAAHRDANIRSIFYYSVFFPVVEIISSLAVGTLMWYWAHAYLAEEATLGQLNAFILCINLLFRPIRMLADKFNTLQMGMVAAERVFKLTDDAALIQPSGTKPLQRLGGKLEYRNVWFAYNEGQDILKSISFAVEPGTTLAIVGATGSGKSSLIQTLLRNYEIRSGCILIDGVDIREYDVYDLRRHIGLVLQDVFLFSGSIYDNITLYNSEITREKVIEAARLCGAHDFIMQLPNGYDQNVMERGSTLSLGQRQLISFVRAILTNPQILILDEATSSIDTHSEQLIQRAVAKVVEGRTAIVIAHRLSTIRSADKILVMQRGEIVEHGSHDELIERNGQYASMYRMQLAETAD